MNVYGYELTPAQIEAGEAVIKLSLFSAEEVQQALEDAGVPEKVDDPQHHRRQKLVAHRATDRLLQKARKAGSIKNFGRVWVSSAPKVSAAGKHFLEAPQQSWHDTERDVYSMARFGGQMMEIMLISGDDEVPRYRMAYLGFENGPYASMDEAKKRAPAFARHILQYLADSIKDAEE